MADRPKKKSTSGERNPDRHCGKAPKKHVKQPDVVTDPERKAQLEAARQARSLIRKAEQEAERQRLLAEIERQKAEAAIQAEAERERRRAVQARKSRQSEAQRRRAEAQQAAAKVAKATLQEQQSA